MGYGCGRPGRPRAVTELFLCNGGVRLHAIDSGADAPSRVPLLIVPGLAESAADYADLILGDYPARHAALPPEFPQWFLTTTWRGRAAAGRIAAHAVHAIQREAREETFWDRLDGLDCPTTILHGDPGRGSQLSQTQIERYRGLLRRPTITGFPASGHDLRSPDPALFNAAIRHFLEALDAEAVAGTDG